MNEREDAYWQTVNLPPRESTASLWARAIVGALAIQWGMMNLIYFLLH